MQSLGRNIQTQWQRRQSTAEDQNDSSRTRPTAPSRRLASPGTGDTPPASSIPSSPSAGGAATRGSNTSGHSRSSSLSSYAMSSPNPSSTGESSQESRRGKTNQLIQNFYMKAAMVALHGRMELTPVIVNAERQTKRVNKWFGMELEDTEMFSKELALWRNLDAYDPEQSPPPPLIIETYLDTRELTPNQTLVILDNRGQRWKVGDGQGGGLVDAAGATELGPEVVLERWRVTLGPSATGAPFVGELPVVYKRGIVLFRTMYTFVHMLPAWKLIKRISKPGTRSNGLRVQCRVRNGDDIDEASIRALETPLARGDGGNTTKDFTFGTVECPVGTLTVDVRYRENTEFRVDDSESLLSSHFINEDTLFFTPSLPSNQSGQSAQQPRLPDALSTAGVAGSLPSRASTPASASRPPTQPGYGSLSSNQYAAYPLARIPSGERKSHLRNASPLSGSPMDVPASLRGSKGSLRSDSAAAMGRRPSVSFNPFKSPSLSGSPSTPDPMGALRSAGSRLSTGSAAGQRLRTPTSVPASSSNLNRRSLPPDYTPPIQPSSASPRPQSMKFSSSFKDRKPRYSSSAAKVDDDGNSSGRASYASSAAAPMSAGFNDEVANTLSRDEKHLSAFMAMLDQDPMLKSFEPRSADASSSKIASTNLNKFRGMQESHSHLTDSLLSSSSILKPPSSTSSSSRHIATSSSLGLHASGSSGSSPGIQISPHTPHAPLVRSRLSEGLTVEYPSPRYHRSSRKEDTLEEAKPSKPAAVPHTSPLDIPSPPRPVSDFRRPNSFNQQQNFIDEETAFDPTGGYAQGRQSLSLGSMGAMAPLSMSRMAQLNISDSRGDSFAGRTSTPETTGESPTESRRPSASVGTSRFSTGSGGSGGSGLGGSSERTVRPQPQEHRSSGLGRFGIDDDEMLFTINDIAGRKSLEDSGRGSSSSGVGGSAFNRRRGGG